MTVVVFVVATLVGLLRFGYKYLDLLVIGARVSPAVPFVEEMTAAYGAALLILALVVIVRRLPLRHQAVPIRLATHSAVALAFSAAHTTLNWILRVVVFGLMGRRYSYGTMPGRYAMELPMDIIVYLLFVVGLYAADRLRAARERELEAAQLTGRLLEAQLRNLRMQLEPHFLFNSLNTVSSTMYDDPEAADEMIGHLSELLRASLQSGGLQEVPLFSELASLEHYLALLRARFGDRLSLSVEVPDSVDALVPSMILQPLVENAARHGAPDGAKLAVLVRVLAGDNDLTLEVRDDGVGMTTPGDPFRGGIGLGAARDRMRLLYGEEFRFTAENVDGGGFQVVLVIPLRPTGHAEVTMSPAGGT
jgi:sensor histidine kinase YesM